MKIILAIFSRNDKVLNVSQTLLNMGHEVELAYTDEYTYSCSYVAKKIDKLGFHGGRKRYNQEWLSMVHNIIDHQKSELLLFVNLPGYLFAPKDLCQLQKKIRVKCWFVDGIFDHPEYLGYYPYIDHIYTFEYGDIQFLAKHGIEADYVPVGYNIQYYQDRSIRKTIDVSFMGSPFKNRLTLLEDLAEKAIEKKWHLCIIGPFYKKEYFWKKWIFARKYPNISKFLLNKSVAPEEANKLYNESKICLNIHDIKHKSLNPRSFDILATGAFEMVDVRDNYIGDIRPPQAMITFDSIDDMLAKVEYYLFYDGARKTIAEFGHAHNIYSMEYSLKQIL